MLHNSFIVKNMNYDLGEIKSLNLWLLFLGLTLLSLTLFALYVIVKPLLEISWEKIRAVQYISTKINTKRKTKNHK